MPTTTFALDAYFTKLPPAFAAFKAVYPWTIVQQLSGILNQLIETCGPDYTVQNGVAIHREARIEEHVIIKGPAIIGAGVFIGAHAYLRGGVWLGQQVSVGPGCEIKTSIILSGSALAHFNFVGDSVVGTAVNMEAGSVIANHYNERTDKQISVLLEGNILATGVTKFGALVGDGTRIGANAVLSPGTVLPPGSIVKRLELVEQLPLAHP